MAAGPIVPPGYRVTVLDEVGSTNAVAFERAEAGEPAGLWIVGRRQTAGRGRQGRAWVSETGNLYSSLLLRDPVAPERLGELPLVIAVSVHDAVADVLPPPARAGLQIKWPNDVLYEGSKIAGILIEGAVSRQGRVVVVGIGINCRHHPDPAAYTATNLAALGYPTEPDILFERLAARVATRLEQWRDSPFAVLREAWIARARGIGESITVRLPNRTVHGRFETLDEAGRLVLRLDDGRRETISAGDVFFG
ncbi:biotin--[acetyl-CoA-carboxylase] ligase [Chthonobacter albigriseus]|uniref:biotin--[acetyl-CoA-carboxylase] ligase n=1 Tax=Chthonobacter albigriseus TaxID=1683161 RepID=UPI0015EE9991|nr:biotin--[acetyl-CoA-carboxylase] ligase [Chthonobacter albigriseus]